MHPTIFEADLVEIDERNDVRQITLADVGNDECEELTRLLHDGRATLDGGNLHGWGFMTHTLRTDEGTAYHVRLTEPDEADDAEEPDPTGYTVIFTRDIPGRPGRMGFYQVDPWAVASIVPCRACGGRLLHAEAGYVPGFRLCETCGRPWLASPFARDDNTAGITVSVPTDGDGEPYWTWEAKADTSEDTYREYRDRTIRYGGRPVTIDVWRRYQ